MGWGENWASRRGTAFAQTWGKVTPLVQDQYSVCEEKAPCPGPHLLVLGGCHWVHLPTHLPELFIMCLCLQGSSPSLWFREDWEGCEPWAGVGMEVVPRD